MLAGFAYVSYQIDKVLDEVISQTEITSIKPLGKDNRTGSWQYQVVLAIKNPEKKDLQISIDHLELLANNLKIGFLEPAGQWQKNIAPGQTAKFKGKVAISRATLDKIQFQGQVLVQVKGRVSLKTSYFGFKVSKDQFWDITKKMFFG